MPLYVLFAYAALAAAAGLLALDVWRDGGRPGAWWGPVRVGVYGAASVAGTTLLVALSGGEAVLVAALVPLTALAVIQFGTALAPGAPGWRRAAWTALVLAVGVAASLQAVPVPLTRAHLTPGPSPAVYPPRPYADGPVRV